MVRKNNRFGLHLLTLTYKYNKFLAFVTVCRFNNNNNKSSTMLLPSAELSCCNGVAHNVGHLHFSLDEISHSAYDAVTEQKILFTLDKMLSAFRRVFIFCCCVRCSFVCSLFSALLTKACGQKPNLLYLFVVKSLGLTFITIHFSAP